MTMKMVRVTKKQEGLEEYEGKGCLRQDEVARPADLVCEHVIGRVYFMEGARPFLEIR